MNSQNLQKQQLINANKTLPYFSIKEKSNLKTSNPYLFFRPYNVKSSVNNNHLLRKSLNKTKLEIQSKKIVNQNYNFQELASKEKMPKNLLESINNQKSIDSTNHESKLATIEISSLVSNGQKEIIENKNYICGYNIKNDNKINKYKLQSLDSIRKNFEDYKTIESDKNENEKLIRIINKNINFQHDRYLNTRKYRASNRFINNLRNTINIPSKVFNTKNNNNYYSNKNNENKLNKSCKKNNYKICNKNDNSKNKIDIDTKIINNRKSVVIPTKSKTQNFNIKFSLCDKNKFNLNRYTLSSNIKINNTESNQQKIDLNKESKNVLLLKNLRRIKKIINKYKLYNEKNNSATYKSSINYQQQNSLSNKDMKISNILINQNLEEDKFKNINTPIVNKVLVFKIENKTMFSSYKKVFSNKVNENECYNTCFFNSHEEIDLSPLKKKDYLDDTIKNNITYNLENQNKKRENKNKRTEFCEECKMNIFKGNNKKVLFLNLDENNSEKIDLNSITPIDKKYHIKQNINLDNIKQRYKINNTKNSFKPKIKIKINESSEVIENDEIINQSEESTYSTQKMKNSSSFYKQTITNNNNNNKSNIIYITSLDENCLKIIFKYLNLQSLNTLRLINKKFYFCFKNIVNSIIQKKIINDRIEDINNKPKILKSLMEYSQLSKLTPLNFQKKYKELLEVYNEKYDNEIKKDLTRTLPENNSFKYGNTNYNKLYHLLTAYVNYNPKIGYAQGLNFLAAYLIYLFDKEEDEFIIFDGLINKFKYDKLLGVNNELILKLETINNFIKKYCYNVYKYLEEMHLTHEFFTTNWMITLFSYSMDNNKYLYYLWEFLIIYNWKFLKCFIVALLNIYENKIICSQPNDLTFLMKNILKNKDFFEKFNLIINKTFYYLNKDEDIV